MRTYVPIQTRTLRVHAAVAGNTFADYAGHTAAAGAVAYGVFRTDGVINTDVAVITDGTALVVAGGPIAEGGAVEVGAGGTAVAHSGGTVVGRLAPGSVAANAGDLVEVKIIHA